MTLTHNLTRGLTGEACAAKVHALHAHGKVYLGDIPWKGFIKRRKKESEERRMYRGKKKVRNEGRAAAPQKPV